MEILFLIFGLLVGAVVGTVVQRQIAPDYKQRWQDALRLMDELRETGEIERKVVVEKQIVQSLPEDEAAVQIRERLKGLAGWQRQEAEAKRLRAGLPPVDDLSNLAGWQLEEMLSRRLKFGYDELGQKFQKKEKKSNA